jgi:hypothetical protein
MSWVVGADERLIYPVDMMKASRSLNIGHPPDTALSYSSTSRSSSWAEMEQAQLAAQELDRDGASGDRNGLVYIWDKRAAIILCSIQAPLKS